MNRAIFGAGCFWHVEDEFLRIKGVLETNVGFMGGDIADPSYERVCQGDTNHVEVVEIKFDPLLISYEQLVRKFFGIHDPTQKDGQGLDIGYQYRSVIFFSDDEQKKIAAQIKTELNGSRKYSNKIVTAIEPASKFYQAEEYHQKYYAKKGINSCRI